MAPAAADPHAGSSSDERDVGWGGREWAEGRRRDGDSEGDADSDPDLERLRADRPPHHEERER